MRRIGKNTFALMALVTSLMNPWQLLHAFSNPLPESSLSFIEFHGFVSQGYIHTTHNHYLVPSSKDGKVAFSELGFNLTKQISNNFRFGFQIFGTNTANINTHESYNTRLDWFYGDYQSNDLFSVRFGRIKIPFGLYNEFQDIDSGRPSILLPQSIYPLTNRDFLLAQSGVELYGSTDWQSWGTLEHRIYGGTIDIDMPAPTQTLSFQNIDVPYLFGGRLLWETPAKGIKLGASIQSLQINYNYQVSDNSNFVKLPALLWLASIEFNNQNYLGAFEYGQWSVEIDSKNTDIQPSSKNMQERYYGMLSYRANKIVQHGVYYSVYYPDISEKNDKENYQKDLALFLRFDLTPYWLIKLSGHHIEGTANVNPQLNDNTPIYELNKSWQMLLLKTTAYF